MKQMLDVTIIIFVVPDEGHISGESQQPGERPARAAAARAGGAAAARRGRPRRSARARAGRRGRPAESLGAGRPRAPRQLCEQLGMGIT